jgi:hypothetical protein
VERDENGVARTFPYMHDEHLAREASVRADRRTYNPPREGLSAQGPELCEELVLRRGWSGQVRAAGQDQGRQEEQ